MAQDKNKDNSDKKPPKPTPYHHPKPKRQYKLFTIRVYVIDGAYNGEMIDEFQVKAPDITGYGGGMIREAYGEIEIVMKRIGKEGHIITTPSGGRLYYPSNRIYYVEAEEVTSD